MKKRDYLLLLLIVAVLMAVPFLLYPEEEFAGADALAGEMVAEINPSYQPWAEPIWEPPGGEIESLLFALQAAVGAGFIGVTGRTLC